MAKAGKGLGRYILLWYIPSLLSFVTVWRKWVCSGAFRAVFSHLYKPSPLVASPSSVYAYCQDTVHLNSLRTEITYPSPQRIPKFSMNPRCVKENEHVCIPLVYNQVLPLVEIEPLESDLWFHRHPPPPYPNTLTKKRMCLICSKESKDGIIGHRFF